MASPPEAGFDPAVLASSSSGLPPDQTKNVSLEDQTLLLLAGLMEAGQEDEHTCKQLSALTKILNDEASEEARSKEPHRPLCQLIDADSVETILGFLDMRQALTVRGFATLTTSAYLKAAGDKGVEYLSQFFYSRVRKATYDDFILAFSVAASIFPVVPDITAELFLSEGFVPSLGSLMKRKWKSKKVEQAALEMLNAACMNTPCREAVKKYCTEWLEEIVNFVPPTHADVSSPEIHPVVDDGSIQQRTHSEPVRNLAAVVLAKLQAVSSPPNPGEEERIQPATTSMEELSNMFKNMLSSKGSQQSSIEGLAYASLQPKVKEKLATDPTFLKNLINALNDAPAKSPATYGALSILVNLTSYMPALSEEQKRISQLKAYANAAKDPTKPNPLSDDEHVSKRCQAVFDAGIIPVLKLEGGVVKPENRLKIPYKNQTSDLRLRSFLELSTNTTLEKERRRDWSRTKWGGATQGGRSDLGFPLAIVSQSDSDDLDARIVLTVSKYFHCYFEKFSNFEPELEIKMPGRVGARWPPWPQLLFHPKMLEKREDGEEYEKMILEEYGAEALKKSWVETCKELEKVTEDISINGTSVIPVLEFEEFFIASESKKEELKERGCFVVRGAVPKGEATKWYHDLKGYVADNKESVTGMPAETPFMFNVYHSPTQQAARSYPNSLKLQRGINQLWHDETNTTSPEPLSYADGFRIRPEKTEFNSLPPHIGSLSRWADPAYRYVYHKIWSGTPLEHDPYDLALRAPAKSGLFPGTSSKVLRAFQGWTALTEAGPGEGSLLLYPNVKLAIAYVLLRPFFDAPEKEEDAMDASKWTFNAERGWYPGTWKALPQIVSPKSHPHLRLEECLVSIPRMEVGDTVWWHADMIHGVDPEHNGTHDSSVLYIAAVPTTPDNVEYMKGQVADFTAGVPPEDFRKNGTDETKFKGYMGEAGILNGEKGRRAAGFEL
ncbi:hypothetical protein G7Y89_g8961 [Cudoniella acicularis]|uniref:UNC-45/Cro1/She4 central domain-containing protein n=1 Tax=Cudoniella acicularis TaxID=354080 RepID=A0A8H4RHS5_9HELO|nr:hypothetical protein G7Y89_g8961 [Cudoniella acicularis]